MFLYKMIDSLVVYSYHKIVQQKWNYLFYATTLLFLHSSGEQVFQYCMQY